ncbi:metal-binding protein [Leptospira sarikeiensis]|uniref:Metal-binding protein n=2 Tax=Leptospira sarikeiensis TaxID=2484943 RepID=A0A4R9KEV6_9LEPT|nr:metal-binding protein [Leptospira sarikeiensis]
MIFHEDLDTGTVRSYIRSRKIRLAGNMKLKIYGNLSCKSGKRMDRKNRVFFASEEEAIRENFRPCGHCLKEKYKVWKDGSFSRTN